MRRENNNLHTFLVLWDCILENCISVYFMCHFSSIVNRSTFSNVFCVLFWERIFAVDRFRLLLFFLTAPSEIQHENMHWRQGKAKPSVLSKKLDQASEYRKQNLCLIFKHQHYLYEKNLEKEPETKTDKKEASSSRPDWKSLWHWSESLFQRPHTDVRVVEIRISSVFALSIWLQINSQSQRGNQHCVSSSIA